LPLARYRPLERFRRSEDCRQEHPELWDAMHKDGEAAHRFYITHTNPSDAAGVPYGFNAEKHVLFPFPQDVCDINPNLRQNPGW
ncbi:MAG: hypothetical protein KBS53_01855, partial [Bacteroidales bacterium]|nr:hypothetical protein [Candidatus Hennigimonas equi]